MTHGYTPQICFIFRFRLYAIVGQEGDSNFVAHEH